jgi:hypothetical protein
MSRDGKAGGRSTCGGKHRPWTGASLDRLIIPARNSWPGREKTLALARDSHK